jgi:hypothetical protein
MSRLDKAQIFLEAVGKHLPQADCSAEDKIPPKVIKDRHLNLAEHKPWHQGLELISLDKEPLEDSKHKVTGSLVIIKISSNQVSKILVMIMNLQDRYLETIRALKPQIPAVDCLAIRTRVLVVAFLEVSKSRPPFSLDNKIQRLEEAYLVEQPTRLINHKIIKVAYLEANSNNNSQPQASSVVDSLSKPQLVASSVVLSSSLNRTPSACLSSNRPLSNSKTQRCNISSKLAL